MMFPTSEVSTNSKTAAKQPTATTNTTVLLLLVLRLSLLVGNQLIYDCISVKGWLDEYIYKLSTSFNNPSDNSNKFIAFMELPLFQLR